MVEVVDCVVVLVVEEVVDGSVGLVGCVVDVVELDVVDVVDGVVGSTVVDVEVEGDVATVGLAQFEQVL